MSNKLGGSLRFGQKIEYMSLTALRRAVVIHNGPTSSGPVSAADIVEEEPLVLNGYGGLDSPSIRAVLPGLLSIKEVLVGMRRGWEITHQHELSREAELMLGTYYRESTK